jgi:hypothetical protein
MQHWQQRAVSLGRFIPHHFDTAVTQGVLQAPSPTLRSRLVGVTARNLAGNATQNYAGNFFAKATTLSNAGDATNMTATRWLRQVLPTGSCQWVTYTFPPPATTAPLALTLRALDTDAVTSATF